MAKIRIMGLDPALTNLGIAVMIYDTETKELSGEDLILVQTQASKEKNMRKNADDLDRARTLHKGMVAASKSCVIAVGEVPEGTQSARGAFSNGNATMLLAACPIPLIPVTPKEAKVAATGDKYACKEEMIEWAMGKYPDLPWKTRKFKGKVVPTADNEHLADACAIVEAGISTEQFAQAVSLASMIA